MIGALISQTIRVVIVRAAHSRYIVLRRPARWVASRVGLLLDTHLTLAEIAAQAR